MAWNHCRRAATAAQAASNMLPGSCLPGRELLKERRDLLPMRVLQKGPMSVRQRRAEVAELLGLVGLLRQTRRDLGDLITMGD